MIANTAAKQYSFDWSDLAFSSKKPLQALRATFVAAPRELSLRRIKQLIREYLPKGNMVLGIAKEPYVFGFEDQPHFKTLTLSSKLGKLIQAANDASPNHKVYTLQYFQRDARYVLEKGNFSLVLLANGSWQYAFHQRPEYYVLTNKQIPYRYISPFVDEAEAIAYDASRIDDIGQPLRNALYANASFSATGMLMLARLAAKISYDYCFQTGVAAGRYEASTDQYRYLISAFNKVVPYQTYALHHGSIREANFAPANDLNFYDTVHAEVMLLLEAQRRHIDLAGATLFINLLPCPQCSRMLTQAPIAEIVYSEDHSAGYAIAMLETAGKKVTRLVPQAL